MAENKDVIQCYYSARPSKRGFAKRMHKLWLKKFPASVITEQRIAEHNDK